MIKQKYSAKELAEGFIFPVKLTKKQKQENDIALKNILEERRKTINANDLIAGKLMQLKFQIEDYLSDSNFDKNKTFGFFLKSYITGIEKKQTEFASEINIKSAVLSQYINNHRKPTQNVIIRLELHSNKVIPATDWYKLLEKENIHELSTNLQLRKREMKFVRKSA